MRVLLWLIPMIAAWASASSAQSGKVIELRSANKMENTTIGGEQVRDFVGNVHFVQPSESGGSVRLWCDRALQFVNSRRIECFGNVRIVRDDVTLAGKEGTYYDRTRRARFPKGVRLERPGTVLIADEGEYETDEDRAHFTGNVVVVDSVSTTTCDDLTYFEKGDRSIAVGRVKIVSPGDGVTVLGDSLVHFGDIDYTIIPKHPTLVQVDTSDLGRLDTLVVVAKTMEAYRDTSHRYVAKDSVMLVRNEMAAVSGQGVYMPQRGLLILTKQPIVWYDENQVSGDSIAVRLEDRKLRSVFVRGRAMAASRSDTNLVQRFDQLTGRTLTLFFASGKIERIIAESQSTSLYYLFDDKTPNGANKSSGDRIIVQFTDGQVDEISVSGGVEGQYMPEQQLTGRERNYDLDGFQWYSRRPRRHNTEVLLEP